MDNEKRFMQDVGLTDLPFPMKVLSRDFREGQHTIANISIIARIIHKHQGYIGTETLKTNVLDYIKELNATKVKVDFNYPFFAEKTTPVSKEKCLVRYACTYSASVARSDLTPQISLKISVPCITTYPSSTPDKPGGLFGQISTVDIDVQSHKDIFPEDLIDIVDRHALMPVYSFLTEEDQAYVIRKIHSDKKTSVVMLDEIKEDLAAISKIEGYTVTSKNFGMLHSYSTLIGTSKSMWIPLS